MDGLPLESPAGYTYLMLNKPRGYVTTLSDEKGRKTVAPAAAHIRRTCRFFPWWITTLRVRSPVRSTRSAVRSSPPSATGADRIGMQKPEADWALYSG